MNALGLENASLSEVIVFAILAGATIGGALLTITRRNPVAAVMSLVATFFALAGIYATISAHFLAVLQVSVYAGAIMVLFIFVVMILNRDEVEPLSLKGIFTRGASVVAGGLAILKAVSLVHGSRETAVLSGPTGPVAPDFGTVAAAGNSLFREFVFPFEAISLLLLVAIIGGIILSRSARQEEEAQAFAEHLRNVRLAMRPEERVGGALPAAEGHDGHGAHASHH
ncbi:MAG TPA: NADH-quinone oxidoreductase subunit J [Polyangia bacterium]